MITERIDSLVEHFRSVVGEHPSHLYLGQKEQGELDKAGGMLVLRYLGMDVVMVEKLSFLKVSL